MSKSKLLTEKVELDERIAVLGIIDAPAWSIEARFYCGPSDAPGAWGPLSTRFIGRTSAGRRTTRRTS